MDHVFSTYGGLLIPGAVALVLLMLVIKVVNAIVRLVALAVLIALLVGGYLVYERVMDMQKAAQAAAHHGPAALAHAVGAPARQAIAKVGLNPAYLRVHVVCAGPNTSVQLRYADTGFLFGVLSGQTFDVPLGDSVRC